MPRDQHGKPVPTEKREHAPVVPEQTGETAQVVIPEKKTRDASYGRRRH
jgi:hypothetical protein